MWVSGIRKIQIDSAKRWTIREGYGQAGWKVRSKESGDAMPHQMKFWEGGESGQKVPISISLFPNSLKKLQLPGSKSANINNSRVCILLYKLFNHT